MEHHFPLFSPPLARGGEEETACVCSAKPTKTEFIAKSSP